MKNIENPAIVTSEAATLLDKYGWKQTTLFYYQQNEKNLDIIVPGQGKISHQRIYYAPSVQELLNAFHHGMVALITVSGKSQCHLYDDEQKPVFASQYTKLATDALVECWIFKYGKEGKENGKR